VMGGGAENIAKKISEMRSTLSGIDFDILGFEKIGEDRAGYTDEVRGISVAPTVSQLVPRKQKLQEAFEGLRVLTGVFMLIGGLGDAGQRAGLSLKKFGSSQKHGDPAWWLTTGTGDMKKAMSNLSLLTSDMADIVKKWKTDFMVISLDAFTAQVDKLSTNAQHISAGIYGFHNAITRHAPENKISEGYDKLIEIAKVVNKGEQDLANYMSSNFAENFDTLKTKMDEITLRPSGPPSVLAGYASTDLGGNINIGIQVTMDAGEVAKVMLNDINNPLRIELNNPARLAQTCAKG